MSSLGWYWHRLKAMSPAELAAHGRRKFHQVNDRFRASRRFTQLQLIEDGRTFPLLPDPGSAPGSLKSALQRDAAEILDGRWIAFGYLPLQLDDPPHWHKDYLTEIDLATDRPAIKLHHRLEGEADIKLMWEPSRWYSLVRLAQAAYVLHDEAAARGCLRLLQHWAESNPPYLGWNWTSALESGLRLIQFVWIDALLARVSIDSEPERAQVRTALLPPHLWFTWRNRSFGSSANNHLIGELSGLILALVRWPGLEQWATGLDRIQAMWEREVLTQFAPDGGNREQALNYQLFSWEFCWQARLALRAAGRAVSGVVEERLSTAAAYFLAVQNRQEQWDYGDSDSAFVTPFFVDWPRATQEWYRWLEQPETSPGIQFWLGSPPKALESPAVVSAAGDWRIYPENGYAVCRVDGWFLRWDLSPLGYLSTAGHGHCDALHLSIWHEGRAIVIDPGTGAYHADRPLRDYLASWEAHNGPHPVGLAFPERRGAFLWAQHHQRPAWQPLSDSTLKGELRIPDGVMHRTITRLPDGKGWQIDDGFDAGARPAVEMEVLWQFAPDVRIEPIDATGFKIERGGSVLILRLEGWVRADAGSKEPVKAVKSLRGVCSPGFRATARAPYLLLRGQGNQGLQSTFVKA